MSEKEVYSKEIAKLPDIDWSTVKKYRKDMGFKIIGDILGHQLYQSKRAPSEFQIDVEN